MQSESAVVSITFRPRSIACRWVSSGISLASGSLARIAVEDALDAVLRHQDRLGADLERPQRRRGVGREERVAGAGGEDHDAALLEVAHGAAADVRLRDLLHVDRRQHARVGAVPLERLLHGERVEHGREHAHVVAGRAVDALGGRGHAAVDVAAADHERELEPVRPDVDELLRERVDRLRVEAVLRASPSGPRRRASAGRA